MAKALSTDLRRRVVEATAQGNVVPSSCRAVRRQRVKCDPLAAAGPNDRHD